MKSHEGRESTWLSNTHLQGRLSQSLQRRPFLWYRGKGTSQGQAELCLAAGDLPQSGDEASERRCLWAQDSVRSSHLHPAVVVVDHRSHLRLLEHDLGHPHCREQGRDQSRGSNTTHASCHGHISPGYKHCSSMQPMGPLPTPHLPHMLPHRSLFQGWQLRPMLPHTAILHIHIGGNTQWAPPARRGAVPAPHLRTPVCWHLAQLLPERGRKWGV